MEDIYYYKYIKYKKKYMELSKLHKGGMNIIAKMAASKFAKGAIDTIESTITSKIPDICNEVSTKLTTTLSSVSAQTNSTSICNIVGDSIKSHLPNAIPTIISDPIMTKFNNECANALKNTHMPKTINNKDIKKYCKDTITPLIKKSFETIKKRI